MNASKFDAKHVYVIHAWDENPTSCWYPWLKAELEAEGAEVIVPAMPNPTAPDLDTWVSKLQELVPEPNEQTCFIGHSIGSQTILRYLARLPSNMHVGGAVFVAPWTHLSNLGGDSLQIAKPWLESPIDWQAVRTHCPQFFALFSDNDPWVPSSEEAIFSQKLGATTNMLHQLNHFDANQQFPEILEILI